VRTIAVVTVARSDYGIYLPLLKKLQSDPDVRLLLWASGMHLSPEFGFTVKQIEADGFRVDQRVEMLLSSDTPEGIAKSIGLGIIGFAQAYAQSRPDIIVVLGDRFEMYAAALAALPFKIPVAHIHGGEVTEGAIDDALRHSMTKLSHLHFVGTEEYGRRVAQLGEEGWRITVSGALSMDNVRLTRLLDAGELETRFGVHIEPPVLLATFHPATLEYEQVGWQTGELLAALEASGMRVVFTLPNADTGGRAARQTIEGFIRTHPGAVMVENLGTQGYFSMMALVAAMVGNSSSGIIEAASFRLPVVNIGTRQRGRIRSTNVIDTGYGRDEVLAGIRRATADTFRAGLKDMVNPYGDGHAAKRIVRVLKETKIDDRLLTKRFIDHPVGA
jgi:UDP-hydrolysing UDP-N-acetyl-D-glucosamine 2-epimerase